MLYFHQESILLLLLGARKKPLFRVTNIPLTLLLSNKVKKSQFQSQEIFFESEISRVTKNFTSLMNKKVTPHRVKNDIT